MCLCLVKPYATPSTPLTITFGLSDTNIGCMTTALLNALKSYPAGVSGLSLEQLTNFSALIHHLKERISWHQSADSHGPPLTLPNDVTVFCAETLGVPHETIEESWKVLCELLWQDTDLPAAAGPLRNGTLLELFLKHGSKQAIGECFRTSKACPRIDFNYQ